MPTQAEIEAALLAAKAEVERQAADTKAWTNGWGETVFDSHPKDVYVELPHAITYDGIIDFAPIISAALEAAERVRTSEERKL